MTPETARMLLLLDAAGCAATAGVVLGFPGIFRIVDPSLRARLPVALALAGTAAASAYGARTKRPTPGAMVVAALLNAGWVATCLAAAPSRTDSRGKALVLTTAVLDGVVGGLQLALRGAGDDGTR